MSNFAMGRPGKRSRTELRLVCCAKNRDEMKQLEEKEDCFVIDFDPNDELDISNPSLSNDCHVIAEKGQVACRDYLHPRYACAKFPFKKTPHDIHCKRCYCYVCDLVAPCKDWVGLGPNGHCHAFYNKYWKNVKKLRRAYVKLLAISKRLDDFLMSSNI
ncbi:hypothetical protein ACJIZ3_021300 [Penstemon smallii]|uniref:Uncharacterized protein n=1 Tax=Penstemon smallii TaxID=265156 RepID=A0ABD3SLK5_9LAMI